MRERVARLLRRITEGCKALRGRLREFYNVHLGPGHVVIMERGKVIYDGPRANMPPHVKRRSDALEAEGLRMAADAEKMFKDFAEKLREHRKRS